MDQFFENESLPRNNKENDEVAEVFYNQTTKRTIHQLCEDEKPNFPNASQVAKTHMYVNDDFVNSAQNLINDLQKLFQSDGFHLRKWSSIKSQALEGLDHSLKASSLTHSFDPDSSQRVLGLEWNLESDTLRVHAAEEKPVVTKRQLLSIIARIFDPLGLLSPTTVLLKILLQDVWQKKLNWDDKLPVDIREKWNKFYSEISALKSMEIPRYLNINSKFELHGFCDASLQAYAAVVYIKILSNPVIVTLVAAKTRIAPMKKLTLPRLELSSALLLSELITIICEAFPDKQYDIHLWTDSTITLSWILNPPVKGNQFVLHRANKIRSLTSPKLWHHIPGTHNPADWATRGMYPRHLKDHEQWWSGPNWLYESSNPFPKEIPSIPDIMDSHDVTSSSILFNQRDNDCDILTKFSSYTKLIRVVAWLLRFLHNIRDAEKITGHLTANELTNSSKTVVKLLQKSAFYDEINLIKSHKPLSTHSKLLPLNVFLDSDQILRVGGRLSKQETMSYDSKYPMIIPKNHPITEAIIRYYHIYSLHAGPELVLSLIRQKFWIPDGRSTVKKELRKCIRCIRITAQPIAQIMGDLPKSRVNPYRVFQQVGCDFAGPILTKCQHKRKYTTFKSYICLFICMCTKAVHIEVVSDLTTEAFLLALRRFIARRGCPSDVFSDNGKTFVGATSYLKTLFQIIKDSKIQDFSSQRQIHWHFIPPYGPNFGGLWESSIKLAKRHLIKSCQGALMTFEELTTTLCLIESCINSRPLCPLSTDPNDLNALTPGHFLIGTPLLALPDISYETNPILSLSSRWKMCTKILLGFWQRWQKEYVSSLTPRHKWHQGRHVLQRDQLVLVKEPFLAPMKWKLALITDVHPGADGVVRVVTIRTKDGVLKRPVQQIATLPDISSARPPEVMERNISIRDS